MNIYKCHLHILVHTNSDLQQQSNCRGTIRHNASCFQCWHSGISVCIHAQHKCLSADDSKLHSPPSVRPQPISHQNNHSSHTSQYFKCSCTDLYLYLTHISKAFRFTFGPTNILCCLFHFLPCFISLLFRSVSAHLSPEGGHQNVNEF